MVHGVKPSVDLEGAQGRPISTRPSPRLIVRTSPRDTASNSLPLSSPRSPVSPQYIPPPSPNAAQQQSHSHWSTLPPSPPRSTPPSPPLVVIDHRLPPPVPVATTPSSKLAYPTPPGSASTSIRSRRGFETNLDVTNDDSLSSPMERVSSRSSSILLGEDLRASNDPQRRPSLILTSAPAEEPQGLALGIDLDQLPPSPRLNSSTSSRRSYPTSPSTSPSLGSNAYFSTSPLNSPVLGSFPSPLLAASSPSSSSFVVVGGGGGDSREGSPNLNVSSPTLDARRPSSPRFSSITDPLNRLVRRASNSSLNDNLPTSIPHRPASSTQNKVSPASIPIPPSPTVPQSPTFPSSPSGSTSLSPNLFSSTSPSLSPSSPSGGTIRRTSFAAQAREKEKEKEREKLEREQKAKEAKFRHARGQSWSFGKANNHGGGFFKSIFGGGGASGGATKGKVAASKRGSSMAPGARRSKRNMWIVGIVLVGLMYVVWSRTSASTTPAKPVQRSRPSMGSRLQRPARGGGGRSFIHPQVVERPNPPSKSIIGAPWRWTKSWFVSTGPVGSPRGPSLRKKHSIVSGVSTAPRGKRDGDDKDTKRRNVFVAAPSVKFVDHAALPPPIEHSDEPERDTLVLYRILGNDLPPRHSPGQTLRNLRFLLQHESDFSVLPPLGPHGLHHSHLYGSGTKAQQAHTQMGGLRVDKYFVLNRIAEPEMVNAIMGLLHLYSVPDSRILVIPFDWNEYQRREFRWDGGVDRALGWGIGAGKVNQRPQFGQDKWRHVTPEEAIEQGAQRMADLLEEADSDEAKALQTKHRKSQTLARLRALDFTYHEKNLYAMNNNGGRNFALQHGRTLPNARWILPLDGNSFFTPAAMYSIVKTLSIAGEGDAASRYVVIPMARLLDNNDVRKNNSVALVPLDAVESGTPASIESELHHRPKAAPDTPEEPQIGFRYDSTESFQEAMRYGRRSKLELLWRLGAIPYSRALDRRTLPWEVTDRAHITSDTWGSIPGAENEHTKETSIHEPHGEFDAEKTPNPERGPLAFAKAGWVYRLFSGHKSQEEHTNDAVTLRNMNRIRGIIAFLERLDEKVARGEEGCLPGETQHNCGFTPERLWNFDPADVERLRQKYKIHRRDALEKVDRYEKLIRPAYDSVAWLLKRGGSALYNSNAQAAATNATLLAMAGYLTHNSSYTSVAADLIGQRFVRQTPLFYRQFDQREQLRKLKDLPEDLNSDQVSPGYTFPPFPSDQASTWGAEFANLMIQPDAPPLAFDPLTFDPLLLLDAVRLLNSPNSPPSDLLASASRKATTPLFASHLSWLLYAPEALKFSKDPPSAEAGAYYDAKVAALAAFLDDARLVGRVANRGRLRLPVEARAEGLMHDGRSVREIHFRLIQGLSNTQLRPWHYASDPISEGMFLGSAHGNETPLDVLGV